MSPINYFVNHLINFSLNKSQKRKQISSRDKELSFALNWKELLPRHIKLAAETLKINMASSTSKTDENLSKVRSVLAQNKQLTDRTIAREVNMSSGAVYRI